MSHLLKVIYVVLLAISFIVVAAQGDDVYNFYFQKAPGPTTVIQGGGTPQPQSVMVNKDGEVVQTAPVAVVPQNAVATSPTPIVIAGADAHKKWEIQFGLSGRPMMGAENSYGQAEYHAKGYSLLVGYNFSKHFGMGVELEYADSYTKNHNPGIKRKAPLDGVLFVNITPLHVQMFGHDFIELGLKAGFMTATRSEGFSYGNGYYYYGNYELDEKKSVIPFFGPAAAININPNFAIAGDVKMLVDNSKYSVWTAGARMRF